MAYSRRPSLPAINLKSMSNSSLDAAGIGGAFGARGGRCRTATMAQTPLTMPVAVFRIALLLSLIWSLTIPAALSQQAAPADTIRVVNLQDLLNTVRADNPSLQASRIRVEALGQRRRQVSALPDPKVMFTYQPFPVVTARGTQRTQFRVEQMIPFPGKLGLKGEIADLTASVAGYQTDAFAQDLELQVKQAYYDLYRIHRQTGLIRDFQDKMRDFESVATTQYEVGRGMQQSILKAQVERNTLEKQALDLSRQERTAAETLGRLLNHPVALPEAAVPVEVSPIPDQPLDTLMQVALRRRPEAGALESAAIRADTGIALARKAFMPDFGVNFTYFDIGAADVPPSADGRNALALGVAIQVPIQRGRLHAGLEEAQLRRRQVDAQQEALETSFRTRIADMLSRMEQESEQLSLYREALIPQAETTLETTLSAYTTGRTDFLNLLDAERMLFMLRMGYEDTLVRYLKDTAALERTLGLETLAGL